jgi:hypothetical protein
MKPQKTVVIGYQKAILNVFLWIRNALKILRFGIISEFFIIFIIIIIIIIIII